MLSSEWTDGDVKLAEDAFGRRFPEGRGMDVWTAAAVSNRDWAGSAHGLSSLDTRLQFKNNVEYHGMEVHAWQYFAAGMYSDASEHFYSAALWREMDAAEIQASNPAHPVDNGHVEAITLCVRLGRYARSLEESQRLVRRFARPEDFDLGTEFVERRENRAQEQLDKFTALPSPFQTTA